MKSCTRAARPTPLRGKRRVRCLVASGVAWVPPLAAVPLLMAVPFVTGAGETRAGERPRQEAGALPVDRWLVSDPFEAKASSSPEDALQETFLTAEPSSQLFPDRDLEVNGSYWHLLREDGASEFNLDSLFPERPLRAVIYAHTYIRVAEDRTVRLTWHGPACGFVQARLNDQLLQAGGATSQKEGAMDVRLAAGWNTFLLKMSGDGCPYRFGAWLETSTDSSPFSARKEKNAARPESEFRTQASRPPGVRRSYPAAWVAIDPANTGVQLSWPAGQVGLQASLVLGLRAWGTNPTPAELGDGAETAGPAETTEAEERTSRFPGGTLRGRSGAGSADEASLRDRLIPPPPPPEPAPVSVQLEVKVGGKKLGHRADLAPPGREQQVSIPLTFSTLRKAVLSSTGAQMRLRWPTDTGDRKRELVQPLSAELLLRSLHEPIQLSGWSAPGASGGGESRTDESTTLRGKWTVPGSLSGFTLELSIQETPGKYRLDGEPVEPQEGFLRLCGPCRQGSSFTLEVEPQGTWTGSPRARIVESGFPQAGSGSPGAVEWLRALTGGGNRSYLKLAAEHAGS